MSIYKDGKLIAGGRQTMPLLSFMWADHQLNDISWLRADTFSWQSGDVYVAAYQHLADDINGKTLQSETIGGTTIQFYLAEDGHKICPASEESNISAIYNSTGIAWYYILDTTNRRFKLPRTKWGFTGIRSGVGGYVEAGLPNITGNFYFVGAGNSRVYGRASGAFKVAGKTSGGNQVASASGAGSVNDTWTFDASRSSSIYGNSTTVQPPATQMYLYFYVGNFTQTALENTAGLNAEMFNGKVDLDFANVSASGKETAISWGMPDVESGIEIPFNSSMDYVAPCDGFIHFKGNRIAADLYSPSGVELKAEYWFSSDFTAVMTPIPKGFRCKYHSGNSEYSSLVFYPAKGENNA